MPISRHTAYVIGTRGDDIKTSVSGPDESNGKYTGWITLGPDDRYRPLLDSGPYYDSSEEALTAMKQLVEEIRVKVKEELGGKDPIEHLLGLAKRNENVSHDTGGN